MKLTRFSDYGLRVLIYLADLPKDRLTTLSEIAQAHGISLEHLRKVAQLLHSEGMIRTVQGKNGGIALEAAALDLTLRQIVEKTEKTTALVECFDPKANQCRISGHCGLARVLHEARMEFLNSLARHTLRSVAHDRHVSERRKALAR